MYGVVPLDAEAEPETVPLKVPDTSSAEHPSVGVGVSDVTSQEAVQVLVVPSLSVTLIVKVPEPVSAGNVPE